MIKGVQSVVPEVADISFYTAREQARVELGKQLWEVLYPKREELSR